MADQLWHGVANNMDAYGGRRTLLCVLSLSSTTYPERGTEAGEPRKPGKVDDTDIPSTRSCNHSDAPHGHSIYDKIDENSRKSQNYKSTSTTTQARTRIGFYQYPTVEYPKAQMSYSTPNMNHT